MSGLTGSPLLRPAELLASLTETSTSGLSTVRSPSPLPDITTVATGRFHRRVFHPLDLQLASLHRLYTFNADPRFQRLRRLMEDEWTPQLTSLLHIPRSDLPMIWDADFMLGPPGADGTDSYVLGEINVSSVFPIPDEASAEIARRVADRLQSKL